MKNMKKLTALVVVFVAFIPGCLRAAAAQTGVPVLPGARALEVVVLGSGGPRPFGRAGSSYIVAVEGEPRILVDAGPGTFLRIGELELDLEKVDTVLLTHLHIDHSGDLAAFFNARGLTADGPIAYHIFGPDGAGLFSKTSRFVDLLVGRDGAFAYQKTFGARESFIVRDLPIRLDSASSKIVGENGLVVEEIATHHGDCPSVAYRITYKGLVVVFSGDMDASAKKIGEAVRDSGAKSLLLSHLAPDVEGQEEAVRKSIRVAYGGLIRFASDKLRVAVGK